MKLGVSITAFNEKHIEPLIRQYEGIADRIIVAVSRKPWFGTARPDNTAQRAMRTHAYVLVGNWATESDQRNNTMDYLRDMDYVIVSHGDTWFTRDDLLKLKAMNLDKRNYACTTYTYWKDYDTVIYPHILLPTIIVRSDSIFTHMINIGEQEADPELLDITCHHIAWVKTDEEVLEKIRSYSHAEDISNKWYNEVWKKWTPEMVDFGPTEPKDFHIVKRYPLPKEIRQWHES